MALRRCTGLLLYSLMRISYWTNPTQYIRTCLGVEVASDSHFHPVGQSQSSVPVSLGFSLVYCNTFFKIIWTLVCRAKAQG